MLLPHRIIVGSSAPPIISIQARSVCTSGGELQRFCVARSLFDGTRFLLADEISTMLDVITQAQIWNFLIEETEKRNIGMVIVSHNRELLNKVCTRIVEL